MIKLTPLDEMGYLSERAVWRRRAQMRKPPRATSATALVTTSPLVPVTASFLCWGAGVGVAEGVGSSYRSITGVGSGTGRLVVGLGVGVGITDGVVLGGGVDGVADGLGAGLGADGLGSGVVDGLGSGGGVGSGVGVGAGVVPSPSVPPSTFTSIVRSSLRPLTVATFVTVFAPAGVAMGLGV